MQQDKELQERAERIKAQLAEEPEEIDPRYPEKSADKRDEQTDEKNSSDKTEDSKEDDSDDQTKAAGYSLGDIVKAPLKPPSPDVNETKKETSNPKVKLLMLIGVICVAFGLLVALAGMLWFGVILLAIGAATIVTDVFVRIT